MAEVCEGGDVGTGKVVAGDGSDGGCEGKAFGLEGWELLLLWSEGGK